MTEDTGQEIAFHYIKSNHFRVVHVDGAWGGITPQRNITLSFYNERPPLPQQEVYGIEQGGKLGKENESKRIVRSGIVREVEVDLVLKLEVAEALKAWLETQIKQLQDEMSRVEQLQSK